jgi:tRNA-uridine 2-sulfurtransferase
MSKKVIVAMSGGVDSSVTAALLQRSGWEVSGVYMKNWTKNLPGFHCPWEDDFKDAKRVAVQLDIPFDCYDFQTVYKQKVVDYMLSGYKSGLTPNPDIMCNQEIKFKLFLDTALEHGADMVATGHYARIKDGHLLTGLDTQKDQSYFLYRVKEEALRYCLMPIGEYEKTAVRQLARDFGLSTAEKKDSQGICFIGEVGIKEFLLATLGPQPAGHIIDQEGKIVGEHDGAIFYTIGQRHGLDVGGGLPYYVTDKDMKRNIVFVTTDLQDKKLWSLSFEISKPHWINVKPNPSKKYCVRTRYRSPLVGISQLIELQNGNWKIELENEVRAITPGQSAVIYEADDCIGGGIIV